MARQSLPPTDRDVPPGAMPEVTPSRFQPATHDFTLQAVIEMQRSIGELCAKVDRLIADVDKQGGKIDTIRMRMAWIAGGAAFLGFILALAIAIAKLIPWGSLVQSGHAG